MITILYHHTKYAIKQFPYADIISSPWNWLWYIKYIKLSEYNWIRWISKKINQTSLLFSSSPSLFFLFLFCLATGVMTTLRNNRFQAYLLWMDKFFNIKRSRSRYTHIFSVYGVCVCVWVGGGLHAAPPHLPKIL